MSDIGLSDQAKIILSSLDDVESIKDKEFNVIFLGEAEWAEHKTGRPASQIQAMVAGIVSRIETLEEKSNRLESQLEKEFCTYRAKFLRATSSLLHPIMDDDDDHEKYFKNAELLLNELLEFVKDQSEKSKENAKRKVKEFEKSGKIAEVSAEEFESFLNPRDLPLLLWKKYAENKNITVPDEVSLLLLLSCIDKDTRHYERVIELVGVDDKRGMIAAKSLEALKDEQRKEREKSSGGGCFIATAVYDSENAYDVLILRNYRDKVLLKSIMGNLFVKFYYIISPPIAKAISQQEKIKNIVKCCLIRPFIKYFIKK